MIIHYTLSTFVNAGPLNEDDLFTDITGKIMEVTPHSTDTDADNVAGEITACYVDVEAAIDNEVNIWDVFDAAGEGSRGLLPYYDLLYDANGELQGTLSEQVRGENVLIIQHLSIVPAFQGYKMGLAALWETIRRFGHGCSLVLLTAQPLNAAQLTPAELETARAGLIRYYQRLGFRGPVGAHILYLDLDRKCPTLLAAGYQDIP